MIRVQGLKKLLAVTGVFFLFGHSIVFYITFLVAYFDNKSVLVTINSIGEANLEFVLIPITLVLGLYGIIVLMKEEIE